MIEEGDILLVLVIKKTLYQHSFYPILFLPCKNGSIPDVTAL